MITPCHGSKSPDDLTKSHLSHINQQFPLGIDNLLGGALIIYLSIVQQHHINTYNVGKFASIRSWNRSIIRLFLDHANELWKRRSQILHDESLLTRETLLPSQAIDLLTTYKTTPRFLLFEQRHLLDRIKNYLRTTHLRNVRSWLNRLTLAIDAEAANMKNGRTDIRRWCNTTPSTTTKPEKLYEWFHYYTYRHYYQ